MVPIRHLCEAIDIDFPTQDAALKKSDFYGAAYRLAYTPTAQNNTQKMRCMPLMMALMWMSSIKDNNRREGSVEKQHDLMRILLERMTQTYQLVETVAQANNYQLELIRKKNDLLDRLATDKANLKATKDELEIVNGSIDEVLTNQSKGIIELPFEEVEKMNQAYLDALKEN